MKYIVFLLCIFFPFSALALEESAGRPDLAIGSMLASLLLVLACIFVFAYLMKKTNLLKNGKGRALIKVIATQPLTSKGRVQLIDIDGQQYLLGVTEQNITLLDKLDAPLTTEKKIESRVTATPFSVLLSKISNRNNE
ncbi:flagellar biosynthetic protein FliO [Psychromonas antarctica]|jgi:flagellar protein FliO/FliZ|uniref:flagellar biosynthetic protein FliO n=1 Tax=Psychromonas antarctica TaxID=67573 RepID=UPI001EE9653F|nr:flagellar biosynthetic protein FliO [Psychromonas antarctica]MCG6199836.1 flagellar biosynthetic protein FliO [Psychromonas antarctica]